MKHREITESIIQAFYVVYNTLGYGFLEKVHQHALSFELERRGLRVVQQAPIQVFYCGRQGGEYFADLLVESRVIIEIKAAETLCDEHSAQLLNYLKATEIEVGLLLNFGPRPQVKRKIYDAAYKANGTQSFATRPTDTDGDGQDF
jgi:GxxExxY protein